jgi:hypothetical protein
VTPQPQPHPLKRARQSRVCVTVAQTGGCRRPADWLR